MLENKESLFEELKFDSEDAFNKLYLNYYNPIRVYLLKYTFDSKKVEDIIQETFAHIWIKRKEITIDTSFSNYLNKIAYYKLIDTYRADSKHTKMLSLYGYSESISSTKVDDDIKEMHLEKLQSCICVLPPKCKEVFVANKISGKKYKEVAKEMGVSVKTVENHVSRAYKILKDCMNNSCSTS